MFKYPLILLFRNKTYASIDNFIGENKEKFDCAFYITDDIDDLKKLYNSNYHLLVTVGENDNEYGYIIKHVPK